MAVIHQDVLPIACTRLSEAWPPPERQRTESANVELLRTLAILEEVTPEAAGDEPRSPEIGRLEQKLNVVLDLVSRLYALQLAIPPAVPVRLAADTVAWKGGEGLAPGDWASVEVYLSPKLPRPLSLLGRVVDSTAEGGGFTTVLLEPGTQVFHDAIDKYLFRQHRRLVAAQRRGGSPR